MKRSDACPSCGTTLRYEPPDGYGITSGAWVCTRCKYRRPEGSPINPWKFLKKKKKRGGSGDAASRTTEGGMTLERFANLKYWESIIAYIIVGLYIIGMSAFFICVKYGTPVQILKRWMKKWMKRRKNNSNTVHGQQKEE